MISVKITWHNGTVEVREFVSTFGLESFQQSSEMGLIRTMEEIK